MIIEKFKKDPEELRQSLGSITPGTLIRFAQDSYDQATDKENDACFWIVVSDKAYDKAKETPDKKQNMITLLSLDGKQVISRGIAHQIIVHEKQTQSGDEKIETTLANIPIGDLFTFPGKRDEHFMRIKKDPAAASVIPCYSLEDHTIVDFDMTYDVTHYPQYKTRVKKAEKAQ